MTPDWNRTLAALPPEASSSLWRNYCDALNRRLLEQWLDGRRFQRALKTDAYDEAVGEGLSRALPAYAHAVHWMDCSLYALQQTSRRCPPDRLVAADVRRLPFATGAFDLVFSGSTLDHFTQTADIEQALEELARTLAPGGTLVLTLDNPLNPVVALRNALPAHWRRKLGLTPYPVGKTLGPKALHAVLRRAGLRPVRWTAMAHCPRWPAVWLCRWLSACGRANRLPAKLLAFEALARWPTRCFSGHYLAVEAVKE